MDRSTPSRAATTSRNRPLPAAQRSFMAKSRTRPPSSRVMNLLSWPPISMMVRTSGREMVNALGVAGDLGDGRVGKPHGVAAVAGGDDGADGGAVQLRARGRCARTTRRPGAAVPRPDRRGRSRRCATVRNRTAPLWSPATPRLCRRKSYSQSFSGATSRFPAAPGGASSASAAWHHKLAALQARLWEFPGPLAPPRG